MRNMRQVLLGLGIGLVSLVIILGGLALSLTEGNMTAPTQTPPSTATPTWQPYTPPSESPSPQPPTATFTLPPPPTTCPPPGGWVAYVVQAGDTLAGLAARYRTSEEALIQANCLVAASLLPGSVLYVPPVPTQTPVPCGPPRGWATYTVRAGDTLYHISQVYGITVRQLQDANCLGNSTVIRSGQTLYVPPWATRTPVPSASPTPSRTPTRTPVTPGPTGTPTATPTETFTPSPTEPSTATPSGTPTTPPTETFTESPTVTP